MRWKSGPAPDELALPAGFVTFGPAFAKDGVPPEALMFLPRTAGSRGLLDTLVETPGLADDGGVGLFLNDPFLNMQDVASRLLRCGVRWVCNLPTVAQFESEFSDQVADVGFTHEAELAALTTLRCLGLKVIVALTRSHQVAELAGVGASAVLVMPTIADMQAGFASQRQRRSAVVDIRYAFAAAGQPLPVLCLLSREEVEAGVSLADGGLVRPEPFAL